MNSFKSLFNNFRITFMIIMTFVFYGSAVLISKEEKCLQNIDNKICKVSTILSKPSYLMFNSIKETQRLLKNKSSSGLIVWDLKETEQRYKKLKKGFDFFYKPSTRKNAGYLLLSLSDPKRGGYPLIELWDLDKQKKINTFNIDLNDIYKKAKITPDKQQRLINPLLLKDGSIIIPQVGKEMAIVKLDKCGKYIKSSKEFRTHHSLQSDANGDLYTAVLLGKEYIKNFNDLHPHNYTFDGFIVLDDNLNIIKNYSLLDIYAKNNLLGDFYDYGSETLVSDVFHVNDVQPYISKDGNKYVLISHLRRSRVLAVDLDNLKILWFIERATKLQHDVDILREEGNSIDISIFDNNNSQFGPLYEQVKQHGNRVAYLSGLPLDSDADTFIIGDKKQFDKFKLDYFTFNKFRENLRPKTRTQGLADHILENDSLMIEETDYGRLFEVEISTGNILWQYYNKGDKTNPYMISWSRRISNLPKGLDISSFGKCKVND